MMIWTYFGVYNAEIKFIAIKHEKKTLYAIALRRHDLHEHRASDARIAIAMDFRKQGTVTAQDASRF
jgi:hypothetical protein